VAKVLLIHPSKWGRGITAIWIPAHTAILRAQGHEVRLFDATFYRDWTVLEVDYNTRNQQYRPTDYEGQVHYDETDVREALQAELDDFQPDLIFWSAISSHIHGEGEYVNVQYGHELLADVTTSARKITAGLQVTATPGEAHERFPSVDWLIAGESELVLTEVADALDAGTFDPAAVRGLIWKDDEGQVVVNPRQDLISDMDVIPAYDYSVFAEQALRRPYNGEVLNGVDYELSRGCIYTCAYCVETVIQRYYGFTEQTSRGALVRGKGGYLRHKSAGRILQELSQLNQDLGVTLIRCQDTNFLTIDRGTLEGVAEGLEQAQLPIMLYIETRPEGINPKTCALLKRLQVNGVGMGVELSTQGFREDQLNRFADQDRIVRAFELLREHGIRRTAYNIIGLPGQDEASILETIAFNSKLDPDNMAIAFYSPYLGTEQQVKSVKGEYFKDYEQDVDGQLRSLSRHDVMTRELLEFYKANFVRLVREGLDQLDDLKAAANLVSA
jgi:radical SAM superfamily enzyme YgiQ (UPF0313 family)